MKPSKFFLADHEISIKHKFLRYFKKGHTFHGVQDLKEFRIDEGFQPQQQVSQLNMSCPSLTLSSTVETKLGM